MDKYVHRFGDIEGITASLRNRLIGRVDQILPHLLEHVVLRLTTSLALIVMKDAKAWALNL